MNWLQRAYEPYRAEVDELYARIDAGEDPADMNPYGYGSRSVVFPSRANPRHLLKLPVAEQIPRRQRQSETRHHIAPLALGRDHRYLEQIVAGNTKIRPAVVVEKVEGVTMLEATVEDRRLITRFTMGRVIRTFNYMHSLGLTIDDESWRNIVLRPNNDPYTRQPRDIVFIDYNYDPTEPYYEKLKSMAWVLGNSATLPIIFHQTCTEMLPLETVQPLTAWMRQEMGLRV